MKNTDLLPPETLEGILSAAMEKRQGPVKDVDSIAFKVGECICTETQDGLAYNGIVCATHKEKAAMKRYQAGYVDGLLKAAEILSVKAQKDNDPSLWGIVADINREIRIYSERRKNNETL